VDSPGEKKLKSANYDLVAELESINLQLNMLNNELSKLKEKDVNVYRSIYETEPPIEKGSYTDNAKMLEKYSALRKLPNSELLIELTQKLDKIQALYAQQNKSFDQLLMLAKTKKDFLARIPAIQPVANKKLERIVIDQQFFINDCIANYKQIDLLADKIDITLCVHSDPEFLGLMEEIKSLQATMKQYTDNR
jgi:hypothetical protein